LYEKKFGGEQKDLAAWSGTQCRTASASQSQAENATWSNAAIKGENAARSNAAIQPEQLEPAKST